MILRRHTRRFLRILVAFWLLGCCASRAEARPGGGHAFSSSSRSFSSSSRSFSSSSRSYGGGDATAGSVVIVFVMLGIAGYFGMKLLTWGEDSQNLRASWEVTEAPQPPGITSTEVSEGMRAVDPNFSLVLFEDFVTALYVQAQSLRGADRLDRISAYLQDRPREVLRNLGVPDTVQMIIVGALRYVSFTGFHPSASEQRITVEFESNYAENTAGHSQSYCVVERWNLGRRQHVLSKPPERIRALGCPRCGGSIDGVIGGLCSWCRFTVNTAVFDWAVTQIQVDSRVPRQMTLEGSAEEQGTDLPTVVSANAAQRWSELATRDPALSWSNLSKRVELIFTELQAGWTDRDETRIRPFVTDRQFQNMASWIQAYRAAGLTNVTDQTTLERVEAARLLTDRYFDAITVRIFASGLDYTMRDADRTVVGGSRTTPRRYSEYWTLIRSASSRGAARIERQCPSCGGPLTVEETGACKYCQSVVTSGDFDWVLSRIEQDEVYRG